MRDESELQEMADKASDQLAENGGTKYPGMSYEEGVRAALQWAIEDDSEESPL